MQKNYKTKLVLFDLDGTLVDTAPDFLLSINNVLKKNDQNLITFDQIRFHISEGTSKLIKTFFQTKNNKKKFLAYRNQFLEEYERNLTNKSNLFDGIKILIEKLDILGINYGVVTNKYFKYAKPILEYFPELKNLKVIICPDHVNQSKPNPEGILLACKKVGVRPNETIYLGDHENDIKAGLDAGTSVIGCLYGYSLKENDIKNKEFSNCNFVNHAKEIIKYIN